MSMSAHIPKRIIQTGKSFEQSMYTRAVVSNITLLNPDYEYLFFDDKRVESFLNQEFPQYRSIFDSFKYRIQRYDFFRYLAVYRYGGFYLDLDVLLASSLSVLPDASCIFPFEGLTFNHYLRDKYAMDWEIGNYAFGAQAGHPFLEKVIENCVRAQKDPAWVQPAMRGLPPLSKHEFYVLNSTGPGLITRTLAENPELAKTVTVLFPEEDVCNVDNWNRFGSLGIHLMEGSWRQPGNYLRSRIALYWERWQLQKLIKQSRKLGPRREHLAQADSGRKNSPATAQATQEPLVSILIPAYNAREWVADTVRSAMAQTWPRKEIIVVDDGSTDDTLAIVRQFESETVHVVTQKNQGGSAARNKAFSLCHGDYIQWLDADDLLAPDKISRQMKALDKMKGGKVLLSSEWGRFMYRPSHTLFTPSSLWCDLSPAEWLLRKMGENVYMQTATWLVSRELTEAAGPWDTRLLGDDDGEYFCRVLLASTGVQFVPDAKVYYRTFGYDSLGYIGRSNRKVDAHWRSMQLHIMYLRSLEESARVHRACLNYLRNSLIHFYPERPDIVEQAQKLSLEMGEPLGVPELSWKYSWMRSVFGWNVAKRGQIFSRKNRWRFEKMWDRMLFYAENEGTVQAGANVGSNKVYGAQGRAAEHLPGVFSE